MKKDAALEAFLKALPKVENHLHLDGALSPQTVKRLAQRVPGSPLKDLSLEEIERKVVVRKPREALGDVLAAFDAFYPLLKSAQAVEFAAYEAAREAARQGVLYHELRFAPVLQATKGFTPRQALEAAISGGRRGAADFRVGAGVIICLLRPFSVVSREKNEEMAALAVEFAGKGVVGVDVADAGAGNEELSSYAKWLGAARAAGLGLTAHAGEAPRGKELEDALELGVNRIGHGVQLRQKKEMLKKIREAGIVLEANLTSNVRTSAVESYNAHPVRDWFDADVKVTVSTDDPGVFGVDLTGEYRVLAHELGFVPRELIQVARNGVESLFLNQDAKTALLKEFDRRAAKALKDYSS